MRHAIKKILYALKPNYVKISVLHINSGETLKGKNIVITGGSRGIGRAMAEKFLDEGATVLITGRNLDHLEKTAKSINNSRLYTKVFDSEDIEHIPEFVNFCFTQLGTVDILVSNAGISLHEESILNVTPEGFDKTIVTNLKSHYFISKAFLEKKVKKMKKESYSSLHRKTAMFVMKPHMD